MGVRVHDGLKLWRDDGGGFGDEMGRNAKAGRQRNSRADRATYTMDPDSDEVDDDEKVEIEKLVAQRLEAKFERDYATADAIREQLQNEYDVKVDDRKRKWTVGDQPFRGAPDLNAPYTRRGGGEVEDVAKVEELVEERADAKARRDYAAADAIRDQLNAMGISVDDRSREWRVADAPYCRGRGDTADVDVATVEALVSERSRAKIAAEYDTADAIRDRLRTEFGVSVDDRVREWVVDKAPAVAAPAAAPAPVVDEEPFVVVDAPTEEPAAAAEEAPAGGQSEAELSALTVPALKDLCRAAGLKVGGKKAELVERIMRGSN
jgi:transposase